MLIVIAQNIVATFPWTASAVRRSWACEFSIFMPAAQHQNHEGSNTPGHWYRSALWLSPSVERQEGSRYRSTCCVQISWNVTDGKSCVIYLTKKALPGSPAVTNARIAPKICQGQPPTMYSECSRLHPNRFTFGGVIAERVNTAKMHRKVNPIFAWSLASSRTINELSLS